jgi:hypothetical protein
MAEELVSKWAAESFFQQFDDAIPKLQEVVDLIIAANNAGRNSEGIMRQATSIREVTVQQRALVDANGNLVSSYNTLNDILNVAAGLKTRYNGSTKEVLTTSEKLIRLNTEEAKTISQTNKALQEAEKIRTQAAKTATENAKASTEASKATLNEAKASTENSKQRLLEQRYTAALNKEKERLESLTDKELAKLNQQQSAYGRLRNEYNAAAAEAKELASQYVLLERELENLQAAQAKGSGLAPGNNTDGQIAAKKLQLAQLSQQMEVANASAFKLSKGLLSIEQAVGQSQRNVGNYQSAVFALTQVLREAPSFANSFQTGLMAISNNLSILKDEFDRVKLATGSTSAAIKIFASSLFSAGNIMTLAFTGLLFLVQYLNAAGKETKQANAELTDFEKSINKISETIGKEVGELSQLVTAAKDASTSYNERSKAVDELQKKYPEVFANMNREIILNGDISKAYDTVANSIIAKAEAQAKADIITKAVQEREKAQLELDSILNQNDKDFVYVNDRKVEQLKATIAEKNRLIEITKVQISADQNARASAYWLNQEEKKRYEAAQAEQHRRAKMTEEERAKEDRERNRKPKTPTDFTNEQLKAEADLTKNLYEQLKLRADIEAEKAKAIASDDKKSLEERLAAYDRYTQARLEATGYELSAEYDITEQKLDKIAEIEAKNPKKQTKEEKDLLLEKQALMQEQVNLTDKFELIQNQLVDENGKFRVDITKKYADQVKKNLSDMAAATANNNFEDGEQHHRLIQKKIEQAEFFTNQSLSFAHSLADVNSAITQRRINEIDAEIEAVNKKRDAEIASIEASTLSEEEKQKKIAEAKAISEAKTKELEADKAARQRRQAQYEKALNIAQIIATTALAVIKAWTEGDPYTKVARSIAAGAVGAAQLAAAIAAPLPQYEEGTKGKPHGGGPALLFEGNRPELVMEPGKKPWIGKMEGIYNLTKGAEVISNKELMHLSRMYTIGFPMLIPQQTSQQIDLSELRDEMKGVKQAIERQPVAQLNVTGMGMQRLTRQANSITEYINSFST